MINWCDRRLPSRHKRSVDFCGLWWQPSTRATVGGNLLRQRLGNAKKFVLFLALMAIGTDSNATPEVEYGNLLPLPPDTSICPADDIFEVIRASVLVPPVDLEVRGISQRIPYRAEVNPLVGSHGETRTNPDGTTRFHAGTDLLGERGESVRAIVSGEIAVTGTSPQLGNFVILRGSAIVPPALPCAFDVVYAHLDSLGVASGNRIEQGEVLGTIGRTGNISSEIPTHLHIELWAGPYQAGVDNRRRYTRDIMKLYGW